MRSIIQTFAATPECKNEGFLTFPNWHRGLEKTDHPRCEVIIDDLYNVWVIVANIADIVIQLAGLLAVIFIIYGGIRYIISQGEPEKLQSAKKILTNAIVGLIFAILASTIVGFIAAQFS